MAEIHWGCLSATQNEEECGWVSSSVHAKWVWGFSWEAEGVGGLHSCVPNATLQPLLRGSEVGSGRCVPAPPLDHNYSGVCVCVRACVFVRVCV